MTRFIDEELNLVNYFSIDKFRTVDSLTMRKAINELPITLVLKDNFRKILSFKTPWDGYIYAFAYTTDSIDKLIKKYDFDFDKTSIFIEDWDTMFILTLEEKDTDKQIQFHVKSLDVKYIMENCLRIPEQRIPNDMK